MEGPVSGDQRPFPRAICRWLDSHRPRGERVSFCSRASRCRRDRHGRSVAPRTGSGASEFNAGGFGRLRSSAPRVASRMPVVGALGLAAMRSARSGTSPRGSPSRGGQASASTPPTWTGSTSEPFCAAPSPLRGHATPVHARNHFAPAGVCPRGKGRGATPAERGASRCRRPKPASDDEGSRGCSESQARLRLAPSEVGRHPGQPDRWSVPRGAVCSGPRARGTTSRPSKHRSVPATWERPSHDVPRGTLRCDRRSVRC